MVSQGFPHIDFTWAGRPGILTTFVSVREHDAIRDRLTSGQRPLLYLFALLSKGQLHATIHERAPLALNVV